MERINNAFREDLKRLCNNHEYSEGANITHRRTDVNMGNGSTRLTFAVELEFEDSETAMEFYWSLKHSVLFRSNSITTLS